MAGASGGQPEAERIAGDPTMAERIDVPLGFDVPDGWLPVAPATVGAPDAAFVLVRPTSDTHDFAPNVTIGVDRRPHGVDVVELADESVRRLAASTAEALMVERRPIGDDRAPGITQVLRLRTRTDQELVQTQVHLTIPLGDTPDDRLVVVLACTCRPDQAPGVIPAFQRLVASIHIRDDAGEGRDE